LIVRVEDGGPAHKAGLKKYDLIIDVDGKKVKTTMDLRNIIAGHNPEETAKLTIYREKIKKIVYIKVIEGAA
jgi:serine protease Do